MAKTSRKRKRRSTVSSFSKGVALLAGCTVGGVSTYGLVPEDLFSVSAGPVVFHPRVIVGEAYSDNIIRGDGKVIPRESDWITIIAPSVEAQLGHSDGILQADATYTARALFYADQDELNAVDHTLSGRITYAGARIRSSTSGSVNFASSIFSGWERFLYDIYIRQIKKRTRTIYNVSERIDYDITAKSDLYGFGRVSGNDYETGTSYGDRLNWEVGGGFGYSVTPKHRFFGEVAYRRESLTPNMPWRQSPPDLEIVRTSVGLSGELTPKIQGTVRVGYEFAQYEDGTSAPDGPSASISLTWQPRDRTKISASFSRSTTASVSWSRVSYVNNYVTITVSQIVGVQHPIALQLQGRYGINDYSGGTYRTSEYWDVSLSAIYRIYVWWGVGAQYEYEKRSGTGWWDNYDAHQIFVSSVFGF